MVEEVVTLSPDPISAILGTGYGRFEHESGIEGLCKITGGVIEILAVLSTNPGNGNFRSFMDYLKHEFSTVKVWHIESDFLAEALLRYGFRPWSEKFCIQGEWETSEGFRWDK
jgi:hypothetical protein